MKRYKFRQGDLVICSKNTGRPDGLVGILMERGMHFGSPIWHIHWCRSPKLHYNKSKALDTELEVNLFNLRRRYRFFNSEGEYYENKR